MKTSYGNDTGPCETQFIHDLFPHYYSHVNLAVYHKKPEPKEQSEGGSHSPTNSSNAARERREIPLACRGARGRMKRSCVLIPSPPPKPTTPSKIQEGTRAANVDFQGNIFNPNETERYKLRVFLSNCLFWDEKSDNWINKGCRVSWRYIAI